MSRFRRQQRFNDMSLTFKLRGRRWKSCRAQFVGTVVDVPLIRPINQATRQAEIPPYQHFDAGNVGKHLPAVRLRREGRADKTALRLHPTLLALAQEYAAQRAQR